MVSAANASASFNSTCVHFNNASMPSFRSDHFLLDNYSKTTLLFDNTYVSFVFHTNLGILAGNNSATFSNAVSSDCNGIVLNSRSLDDDDAVAVDVLAPLGWLAAGLRAVR